MPGASPSRPILGPTSLSVPGPLMTPTSPHTSSQGYPTIEGHGCKHLAQCMEPPAGWLTLGLVSPQVLHCPDSRVCVLGRHRSFQWVAQQPRCTSCPWPQFPAVCVGAQDAPQLPVLGSVLSQNLPGHAPVPDSVSTFSGADQRYCSSLTCGGHSL